MSSSDEQITHYGICTVFAWLCSSKKKLRRVATKMHNYLSTLRYFHSTIRFIYIYVSISVYITVTVEYFACM
jgi:hypothetical protein